MKIHTALLPKYSRPWPLLTKTKYKGFKVRDQTILTIPVRIIVSRNSSTAVLSTMKNLNHSFYFSLTDSNILPKWQPEIYQFFSIIKPSHYSKKSRIAGIPDDAYPNPIKNHSRQLNKRKPTRQLYKTISPPRFKTTGRKRNGCRGKSHEL